MQKGTLNNKGAEQLKEIFIGTSFAIYFEDWSQF